MTKDTVSNNQPCPNCGSSLDYHDGKCNVCCFSLEQSKCNRCEALLVEIALLREKNLAWMTGVEQSNTDIVDMQRDEFKRIIALLRPPQDELTIDEIVGICERGIACIEQTVPVIVQRDRLQNERDKLKVALGNLADEASVCVRTGESLSHDFIDEAKAVIAAMP